MIKNDEKYSLAITLSEHHFIVQLLKLMILSAFVYVNIRHTEFRN